MAAYFEHDIGRRWRAWRIAAWTTAAMLLALPLVAMQLTDVVDWTGSDFLIMGTILFTCCAVFHLGTRGARNFAHVAAVVLAVGTSFLMVWINLAVGFVGAEHNAANLMYVAVIVVAIVGSLFAGSRPASLARAMYATAIAEALAAAVVVVGGLGNYKSIALSVFFVVPWLAAAALFARSARTVDPAL